MTINIIFYRMSSFSIISQKYNHLPSQLPLLFCCQCASWSTCSFYAFPPEKILIFYSLPVLFTHLSKLLSYTPVHGVGASVGLGLYGPLYLGGYHHLLFIRYSMLLFLILTTNPMVSSFCFSASNLSSGRSFLFLEVLWISNSNLCNSSKYPQMCSLGFSAFAIKDML